MDRPILAFDCSTPASSVALKVMGTVEERAIAQGRQSALLVAVIDELMRARGIAYSELGAMVTTLGPGSFTGLRVGLATLHGLALASGVPVKTLTSLQTVAWQIARGENPPLEITVALNAGKGELFTQGFALEGGIPRALGQIALLAPPEVPAARPVYGNALPGEDARYIAGPSAALLCEIADLLPATPLAQALPLYIRPPDAKIPARPAWLVDG